MGRNDKRVTEERDHHDKLSSLINRPNHVCDLVFANLCDTNEYYFYVFKVKDAG